MFALSPLHSATSGIHRQTEGTRSLFGDTIITFLDRRRSNDCIAMVYWKFLTFQYTTQF